MALEEATRSLNSQRESLDGLRTRSGTILTGGGLVFSLFTAQALGKHHVTFWIWLALASFVVLAITTIALLWPRTLVFRNDVSSLLVEIDELLQEGKEPDLPGVERDWAYWANQNYDCNQKKINRMTTLFTAGLLALAGEVVFLGLALVIG